VVTDGQYKLQANAPVTVKAQAHVGDSTKF